MGGGAVNFSVFYVRWCRRRSQMYIFNYSPANNSKISLRTISLGGRSIIRALVRKIIDGFTEHAYRQYDDRAQSNSRS